MKRPERSETMSVAGFIALLTGTITQTFLLAFRGECEGDLLSRRNTQVEAVVCVA